MSQDKAVNVLDSSHKRGHGTPWVTLLPATKNFRAWWAECRPQVCFQEGHTGSHRDGMGADEVAAGAGGGKSAPQGASGGAQREALPQHPSLGFAGSWFKLCLPLPSNQLRLWGAFHAKTFLQLIISRGRDAGGRDVLSMPERGDTDSLIPSSE